MITYVIIAVTVLFSYRAFSNDGLYLKYRFNPYYIKHEKQWYRFFSHALLHADWGHLLVNMFVLFNFGRIVEQHFQIYFQEKAMFYYVLLYVFGVGVSVLYPYRKHYNDGMYNAVGASGAVSAVLFSSIVFYPMGEIYLFFIPVGIPAFIFGFLYLLYSAYMAKKSNDNIGHDAHFYGAVFGFLFTLMLKPSLFNVFINQILN